MGRWIAIGRVDGWDDLGTFSDDLTATGRWRVDARTTITEVVVLGDGRMVAECHATTQADFEEWLHKTGWQIESISPIRHVARTGEIWKIG